MLCIEKHLEIHFIISAILFLLQCEKVCIEGESRDETESEDE